jgi:hypothetical protein
MVETRFIASPTKGGGNKWKTKSEKRKTENEKWKVKKGNGRDAIYRVSHKGRQGGGNKWKVNGKVEGIRPTFGRCP